jgi:amidase
MPGIIAAVAGSPDITVPAGWASGVPVGLSFFGRAWSEGRLLAIAYSSEQATRHCKPPKLLATVELQAWPYRPGPRDDRYDRQDTRTLPSR